MPCNARTQALSVVFAVLWASAASAQTITYGPIIGRGETPDKTVIKWGTSSSSDATSVSYRKKGATSFSTVTGAASKDHEILLTGLDTSSTYEYFVQSGSTTSSTYAFPTCPAPGAALDVVFYGDNRSGPAEHQVVVDHILAAAPDLVFASGDLYYDGTYAGYISEFFPVVKELAATTPYMAAPGNHDAKATLSSNYGLVFPMARASLADAWQPYYSFVCGNAMFISLNSNDAAGATQKTFLTDRLAAAKADATLDHVFVWFHHAPYSPGSHGDTSSVDTNWVPLFEDPANKVTAVFSGHDHIYARMQHSASKVLYIVSGGGGADLYSVTGSSSATKVFAKSAYNFTFLHIAGTSVTGTAYDDAGVIIDTFSAGPAVAMGGPDGGIPDDAGVTDPGSAPDLGVTGSSPSDDLGVGPGVGGSGATGTGCAMTHRGAGGDAAVCMIISVLALAITRRRRVAP